MKVNKYFAICKKTGKKFKDFENKSGVLTRHIKKTTNIVIPSSFIRRKYKEKHGKYWHERFFDIIENTEKYEIKKCKYCNWETKDIKNLSGCYTSHLKNKHNINIKDYLKEFPEEKKLFKTFIEKENNKKKMEKSEENYVICKICNKKLKSLTNTHLKKHNTTLEKYKLRFPQAKYHSKKFLKITTKNLIEASKNIEKSFSSKPEINIREFITDELKIECEANNRKLLKGVEIDIICKKYNLGIEFNGNLYHSENYGNKNSKFHISKTKLMNEKGFGLIHIFEDEWELKNDIVKSKLRALFNKRKNAKIIHARKCTIQKVPPKEKNSFLEKFHIQGQDRSSVHLGAYFDNELIAVMTFDNKRQMNSGTKIKKDIFELKRFCVSSSYICTGIANRLIKYFINNYNPKKIISFADRRWTLSEKKNLYTNIGFKLTKILPPDYFYYNNKIHRTKRYHKFSFGKSSLKKKFPEIFNPNKTEWEIMQELGYDRIWDCGKFKYELDI